MNPASLLILIKVLRGSQKESTLRRTTAVDATGQVREMESIGSTLTFIMYAKLGPSRHFHDLNLLFHNLNKTYEDSPHFLQCAKTSRKADKTLYALRHFYFSFVH
jgi:hypothetical protein